MSDFTWVRLLLGLLIGLGSVLLLMIHKLFAARAANPRDRFAPFSVVFLNYLFVWILFLLWMLFYEPDIALVVFRVSFHLLPSVIAHSLLLLALTPLLRDLRGALDPAVFTGLTCHVFYKSGDVSRKLRPF